MAFQEDRGHLLVLSFKEPWFLPALHPGPLLLSGAWCCFGELSPRGAVLSLGRGVGGTSRPSLQEFKS